MTERKGNQMTDAMRDHRPASFQVRPITPLIGAEIDGIDLSEGPDEVQVDDLRDALLAHQVLF